MVLQTSLPNFERTALKRNLEKLEPDSTDIYMESQIEKYCNRSRRLASLTFPEYLTFYTVGKHSQANEDEENENPDVDPRDELLDADNTNETAVVEFYGERLPIKVRDQNNRIYSLRKRKAFWRTHDVLPSSGDAYFYQKIVLQLPSFDFNSLYEAENPSWRGK
jgi:hypothetical protein